MLDAVSTVAGGGAATTPYAAFHFNRGDDKMGRPANLAAMPVVSASR